MLARNVIFLSKYKKIVSLTSGNHMHPLSFGLNVSCSRDVVACVLFFLSCFTNRHVTWFSAAVYIAKRIHISVYFAALSGQWGINQGKSRHWRGGQIFPEDSGVNSAERCGNLCFSLSFLQFGMWMGWLELLMISYNHDVNLKMNFIC